MFFNPCQIQWMDSQGQEMTTANLDVELGIPTNGSLATPSVLPPPIILPARSYSRVVDSAQPVAGLDGTLDEKSAETEGQQDAVSPSDPQIETIQHPVKYEND